MPWIEQFKNIQRILVNAGMSFKILSMFDLEVILVTNIKGFLFKIESFYEWKGESESKKLSEICIDCKSKVQTY